MKASLFTVEPSAQSSFRCVRVRQQKLGVPWHFHPEYQLTYVLGGAGQRVVGDSIEPLAPGDLTLLGPDVPHFWDVDDAGRKAGAARRGRVDAVLVQFKAEFLGRDFWGAPETQAIVQMLRSARRGLEFAEPVRHRVGPEIRRLPGLDGLPRLLALIGVLHVLATDGRARPICSAHYLPRLDESDRDRLAPVIQEIHRHLGNSARMPGRSALARIAGLSERSFSRYFHAKMGRSLPHFVNELRVGRAKQMLSETDLPVTRVAIECGFHNLSNFNAQFRTIAGAAPLAYRRTYRRAIQGNPPA